MNKAEGCGGEGLTRRAVRARRRRSCPSTQPVIDAEARLGTRFARLARVPTGCEPACAAAMAEHSLLSEVREPSRRQDPTVWETFAKHPAARGWLLASDSLPCWRKVRLKAMVRHRFRGLLPFCLCRQASRQKGRRDEIGSPSWLCAVAHHAAQPPRASRPPLKSWLCSLVNRASTNSLL